MGVAAAGALGPATRATPSPRPAPPGTTVTTAPSPGGPEQAHLAAIVDQALTRLGQLISEVRTTPEVPPSDAAVLQVILADAEAGALRVRAAVALVSSASGATAQATDVHTTLAPIVHLVIPQVDLVVAADRATSVAFQLASLETAAARLVDQAAARGHRAAPAQQLSDMQSQVAQAQGDLIGVPSASLALVPAGWPDNATVLQPALDDLFGADAGLYSAARDMQAIWQATQP
jgi:hypothetical protein